MEPVRAEPERRTSRLPVVLGGLVLAGLVMVCLGATWLVVRQVKLLAAQAARSASQAVDQFVQGLQPFATLVQFQQDLSAGDTRGAYGLTSDEFQKRRTPQEFADLVRDHPELAAPWTDFGGAQEGDDALTVQLNAEMPGGRKVPVKVRLVKEKGAWKVDDVTLP